MSPVASITLPMYSRWVWVMKSFMLYRCRSGIASNSTIANPAYIAPATKYGGKNVVCQPGICETAKSNDTVECTDSTSGVESPARIRYAISYRCQWRADPRQPHDNAAYKNLKTGCFALSRRVARSGIRPMYQNRAETVAYVETANTSHIRGLRNCGQIPIVFGYG